MAVYKSSKILYISDDNFMHVVINKTFKNKKIITTDAYSANQALEILKTFKPDLILSDINMPGKSGLELCEITSSLYDIPFVIYTSSEHEDLINQAFSAGAKGYILKKYIGETLSDKILKFIE